MTTLQLAFGYLRKCESRIAMMEVLINREEWSDVVRESQEIVELALKGILRSVGIDPPKWHDVGELLVEHKNKLLQLEESRIQELAEASKLLRGEREFSFYGDVDFIPTDQYHRDDAMKAFGYAKNASAALKTALAACDSRPK